MTRNEQENQDRRDEINQRIMDGETTEENEMENLQDLDMLDLFGECE